jgi:UDP-N-acetylmuramoyl-tripeptide--D-alanyl-D-alanine ligase
MEAAVSAAETFDGISRRFTIHRVKGVTVIDDAYNANPASFKAALETLRSMQAKRHFVVAGGMLELGEGCEAEHRALGVMLAQSGLSGLALVGPLAQMAGDAAIEKGLHKFAVNFHATPEQSAETFARILKSGDVILVKGSHGIQLERCVEALLKNFGS